MFNSLSIIKEINKKNKINLYLNEKAATEKKIQT